MHILQTRTPLHRNLTRLLDNTTSRLNRLRHTYRHCSHCGYKSGNHTHCDACGVSLDMAEKITATGYIPPKQDIEFTYRIIPKGRTLSYLVSFDKGRTWYDVVLREEYTRLIIALYRHIKGLSYPIRVVPKGRKRCILYRRYDHPLYELTEEPLVYTSITHISSEIKSDLKEFAGFISRTDTLWNNCHGSLTVRLTEFQEDV